MEQVTFIYEGQKVTVSAFRWWSDVLDRLMVVVEANDSRGNVIHYHESPTIEQVELIDHLNDYLAIHYPKGDT